MSLRSDRRLTGLVLALAVLLAASACGNKRPPVLATTPGGEGSGAATEPADRTAAQPLDDAECDQEGGRGRKRERRGRGRIDGDARDEDLSPADEVGWGAALRPASATAAGFGVVESDLFPAVFPVSPGVHVVKVRYGGQERTAAVAVASGERAEVRVTFATGELFLQALDASGGEIVGDSSGVRSAWRVDIFPGGGEESQPVASTCSFPARVELAPGTYRVRARWKGVERVIEEVTVAAGAGVVRDVSLGKESD